MPQDELKRTLGVDDAALARPWAITDVHDAFTSMRVSGWGRGRAVNVDQYVDDAASNHALSVTAMLGASARMWLLGKEAMDVGAQAGRAAIRVGDEESGGGEVLCISHEPLKLTTSRAPKIYNIKSPPPKLTTSRPPKTYNIKSPPLKPTTSRPLKSTTARARP
eukprot:350028-Chlamydomonas_euryale.AAC.2